MTVAAWASDIAEDAGLQHCCSTGKVVYWFTMSGKGFVLWILHLVMPWLAFL
jgi:hypothetical protein